MKTKKKIILPVILALVLLIVAAQNIFAENDSENLIPIMTSNTAPSGIVTASSIYSSTSHQPYQVFDRSNEDYGWSSNINQETGWVAYEFPSPVVVNKYILKARGKSIDDVKEAPRDFTFEGWNGTEWVVLDTRTDIVDWATVDQKEFSFSNQDSYIKYRLNISKNNGQPLFVTVAALEMYNTNSTPVITPTPAPTVEPTITPAPTPQSGNRAILVVSMITGLEKEFDLPIEDVNAFLSWYDNRAAGNGPEKYGINKYENNQGPFSKRTDYVIFDKILTFEVSEYEL